jgi:hypothetical protein
MKRVHLYFDDSGVRRPDRKQEGSRRDGMDHFALGGVLVEEEKIGDVIETHRQFMRKWRLEKPLHSTRIRGRREEFAWLGTDRERENDFLGELEATILSLPMTTIACVIDRPGYVARYADRYKQPWLLCKTAFAILVERAAKFAARSAARMEIYFEAAGKQEDRDILNYALLLETEGMPFDGVSSGAYQSLRPSDFKDIIIGQPNRVTKQVPMVQFADLVLYPMVKGGYDPEYRPHRKLIEAGRVIDCSLNPEECPTLGVKYSCFERIKNEGPA